MEFLFLVFVLFAGIITIVSLVSPYKNDRDAVRKRHEDQNLKFVEVFMDVPLDVVKDRDPKGLYKKVEAGELKHFTGVDDPYEPPVHAEIVMKNHDMTVQASVDVLMRYLQREGVLTGEKTHPQGLPYPDGGEIVDLHVSAAELPKKLKEAATLPKVLLSDLDVNWLQTIGEGWAAPLRGFMREGALLQTIHFNTLAVDPFNLTGNKLLLERETDFSTFPAHLPPTRVSMSVPVVLPISPLTKKIIERGGLGGKLATAVTLVNKHGDFLAILRRPEIYAHRKEEIISRIFGVIDEDHPYIQLINKAGDWLLGGEVELLGRIKYNDGLDRFRKTSVELTAEFKRLNADAVYAFQTRNPTHAGHAYLMKMAGEKLKEQGYSNPVLWLSPLGGWTKDDDVPLDVRVKQHEAVLQAKQLDPKSTVLAIWPAPMLYAGPTEVLFHAKSRRNAGCTYFVAGRDPAGMKGSSKAVAHPDDDLYDGRHGRYVLSFSPGQSSLTVLPFSPVSYDKSDHKMRERDPKRPNDFIDISGSKMRALAKGGAVPCDVSEGRTMPSDLIAENCVPPGFMVEDGWKIVSEYYQHADEDLWVPWSVQKGEAKLAASTVSKGSYGKTDFQIFKKISAGYLSYWHDIALRNSDNTFNMVVEIPMYSTAKMEMSKSDVNNPIMQDYKEDDAGRKNPRYYAYGTPFFNYGFLPQTWEDVNHVDPATKARGDGDPIDVIEIGDGPMPMGEVVRVKVLGSFCLVDEGETDYKIIVIRADNPHAASINSLRDLERYYSNSLDHIKDWLVNYKTAEGKGVNTLSQEEPATLQETLAIIDQVEGFYKDLLRDDKQAVELGYSLPAPESASKAYAPPVGNTHLPMGTTAGVAVGKVSGVVRGRVESNDDM
ncbi:adenylyl-sulfate kinase [archaeon]|nr:MAG: adenylyl-sulfate kinase [archaeon]